MDKDIYRIIDANLNRLMEAMRVCEDITRFSLDDGKLTLELKNMRHAVARRVTDFRKKHLVELMSSRNALLDVGLATTKSEGRRKDLADLFLANSQRGKESLRVLEEVLKLFDGALSRDFKKLRFRLYDIEKVFIKEVENLSHPRRRDVSLRRSIL